MDSVRWGIIGCGDVTEVKSGPAFNLVPRSSLVAVMRRDAGKAKDYAARHGVPKWYADAHQLINDPDVNAIYIATPPRSHEEYALAAMQAGKPVYIEKPVTLDEVSCRRISEAASRTGVKCSVAHYRRALPLYLNVKELLDAGAIGEVRFVNIEMLKTPAVTVPNQSPVNWRVDPAISGGGLFHDLSPHHLDIMLFFFGAFDKAFGHAANQSGQYPADDIISGQIVFSNGVLVRGVWCFNVSEDATMDVCEIVGSKGAISFPFFTSEPVISFRGKREAIHFKNPAHIQQPMIEKVVSYFLDEGPNPCSAEEAAEVMKIMDAFTGKKTG